ncbi:MAG: RluA family pseudouridine synthase [Clostridia bacterium]|nr:RluA family pseudouridine synthase [Clostridia bacterium]
MEVFRITADGLKSDVKIRDYLKRIGFSTSLIGEVKYDNVLLNGRPVHMREPVKNGDLIEVHFPILDSEGIEPIDIPIDVLFEDEHILVVNKPTNMPIHPSRGNSLPTLANAVRAYIGEPFVFRCITRLDRDTSGIVLIAKHRLSAARLSGDMKAGGFEKTYVARVVGEPLPPCGRIDAPIERAAEGEMKRTVRPDGKPSVTDYENLSVDAFGNTLVRLKLLTGRTHQIRVHMAYIGHPLYNDFLYGERVEEGTYRLHCEKLVLKHPFSGEMLTIICKNEDI